MTTKVTNLVCFLLFRLLLPLTLLAACVVRYNSLSFIYLALLLVWPLLHSPSQESIKGGVGIFLKVVIVVSSLGTLSHVVFHIVLAAIATDKEPYGYILSNCSTNEKLARQIAVERLDGVPFLHVLRLVFPDVIVLAVSILVYIVCFNMLKPPETQQQELPTINRTKKRNRTLATLFTFLGEILMVIFLAASGIIVPSAIAGVYFLSFLCIATWWALYRNLGIKFAMFKCFILVWSGLHILVLHLYQFQFFQEFVPPSLLVSRILGLTSVIETDCTRPWAVVFHDQNNWPNFVNPAIVLVLYIVTAVETRHWFSKKKAGLSDVDGAPVPEKRSGKRRRTKTTERQVLPQHQESQIEQLVGSEEEAPSYSSFDPVSGGSPREEPGTPPRISPAFDDEEEDEMDHSPRKTRRQRDWKRPAMVSFLVYIMKQSYVLTLIAMMAWSITFHSWLTFVLLLSACVIWMFPSSRHVCYVVSPFIVLYGEVLLIIQYVYGMNLKELPDKSGHIELAEVGFQRYEYPCLQLALQVVFTFTFWMTMRQFMRERSPLHPDGTTGFPMGPVPSKQTTSFKSLFSIHMRLDSVDGYDSHTMQDIGAYVWSLLSKYWIFVCGGMLLFISIQDVVIYRIIYFIFFLYFVLAFQLSYRIWRCTMFVFWWTIIFYSMVVLIMLYTYQFSDFPQYWKNGTGLSSQTLADIGLEEFDTAGLFKRLLTPTSFLIVVILQVHYFHTPFLKLSDLNKSNTDASDNAGAEGMVTTDTEGTSATDGSVFKKTKKWRKKLKYYAVKVWYKGTELWQQLCNLMWKILYLHINKIVLFTIIVTAVSEVSAVSAVYVILLGVFMPFTGAWIVMSHFCQIWTALVLLSKTIYQLTIIEKDYWFSNCTMKMRENASLSNVTQPNKVNPFINGSIDNAQWVGFVKSDSLSYYLRRYIAILLLLVIERIVHYHQQQYFNHENTVRPKGRIIFLNITRADADRNLIHCAKYFANYFFYKFGLEVCYIMMAVTISVRVDVYSVIYAILLGILLCLDRRGNARMWPVFTAIVAILLPVQYLLCLGFPAGLCIVYPWLSNDFMNESLEKWLFLPDYFTLLDSYKLLADFFLLLFVCLQLYVFQKERKTNAESYEGGDNRDILPEVEANSPIPVDDFTSVIKSYLDLVKNAVFFYMYWVTMFVVFLAGTSRINIFSMGYVIAVFCFMWYGQEFLLKPLRKIRRSWKFLIGYTYIVLFLKAALQLLGCVYISYLYEKNQCWLIQLLGLTCLSPTETYNPSQETDKKCLVEEDNTGLMWDVICFTFLLLQLRIYNSQYFRHIVASSEAQHRLAARGAELINSILVLDVKKQKEDENAVLYNIKKKMQALKDKQTKVRKDYVETEEHFQAIRSGDYYLFEDDEAAADDKKQQPDSIKLGQGEEGDEDKVTPMELVTTALDSGMKAAVDKAKEADEDAQSKKSDGTRGQEIDDDFGAKDSDDEEDDVSEDKDSVFEKVKNFFKFITRLLESFVDSVIDMFNDISKNYRMVASTLEEEMCEEKQKIHKSHRPVSEQMIDMDTSGEDDGGAADGQPSSETVDLVEVKIDTGKGADTTDGLTVGKSASSEESKFDSRKPKIFLLLEATYYVVISRSEMVCYFLMILNQILYASLLSLPLPLMVFLWGMLSVPRPSKTFWITVITYTEALVVVKYLFQFGFFPWNDGRIDDNPFFPPRIIGIEQTKNYASADLVLLLALFIHRSILKRYGLWKDAEEHKADLEEVISRPSSPSPPEADADVTRSVEFTKTLSSIEESQDSLEGGGGEEAVKTKKSSGGAKKYLQPFNDFYQQLTNPMYNATTDVYAAMFFCDFINFLIIVFGYWAFGPAQSAGGDVTAYIKEDKVPTTFLVMLVTQFILIIIDRGLYLKKYVLGKFVFQIILVTLLHIWLFFVLPAITARKFTDNIPAQLWYFVKCLYFGLSAYQIRSSYPTRILGNFLTKKYNYLNLFLFKGFLAIPFLLELRVLMDWMWTDTTMAIGSWLQMEDIYANIYVLKCWRESEKNYPTPRGQKKRSLIKYGLGGSLLILIIFIIWFPLVIFSLANTVYVPNPPVECTVTMAVGGFQPLFKMTAQSQSIRKLGEAEYNHMKDQYSNNRDAIAFITTFEPVDVTVIQLNGNSTSVWGISPPSQQEMVHSLNSSVSARMEFYITFTRAPNGAQAGESLRNEFSKYLDPQTQQQLAFIIQNVTSDKGVQINDLFPRFIHLGSKGQATAVNELLGGVGNSNVLLSLGNQGNVEWWRANEVVTGDIFGPPSNTDKKVVEETLTIVTFNDRVAPEGFSLITGYGIIGLYLTFILLIGRILRLSTTGLMELITYKELPYVDNILQLCLDLYLVREMGEFRLEEDLYAKLLFVFRSSQTRIKWTRLPQRLVYTDKEKSD